MILICNIHRGRGRVALRASSELHSNSKKHITPTPSFTPPPQKKKFNHPSLQEKNHRGSPGRFSTHLPGGIRISLKLHVDAALTKQDGQMISGEWYAKEREREFGVSACVRHSLNCIENHSVPAYV